MNFLDIKFPKLCNKKSLQCLKANTNLTIFCKVKKIPLKTKKQKEGMNLLWLKQVSNHIMCSYLIKREKLCWFHIANYCLLKYVLQTMTNSWILTRKINFIENKFLCNLSTWWMERNNNMINCGWTLWEAFSVEFNKGNVLKDIAMATKVLQYLIFVSYLEANFKGSI